MNDDVYFKVEAIPTNIEVHRTFPTILDVSWDPPLTVPHYAIAGYRVYYRPVATMSSASDHLESWPSQNVVGPHTSTQVRHKPFDVLVAILDGCRGL